MFVCLFGSDFNSEDMSIDCMWWENRLDLLFFCVETSLEWGHWEYDKFYAGKERDTEISVKIEKGGELGGRILGDYL